MTRNQRGLCTKGSGGIPVAAVVIAISLVALSACTAPPAPSKPVIHTTKAFDTVYGELPPIPVQSPAYATVVYFPAAKAPGRFVTAPIFTTEEAKVEFLTVRTAVRGIDQEEFRKGIALPFPEGSDLISLGQEQGKSMIRLGGTFRANSMSKKERENAACVPFSHLGAVRERGVGRHHRFQGRGGFQRGACSLAGGGSGQAAGTGAAGGSGGKGTAGDGIVGAVRPSGSRRGDRLLPTAR